MGSPFRIGALLGAALEVRDLDAAEAFYGEILGESARVERTRGSSHLVMGPQFLELVRRARPRVSADTAQHHALVVSGARIQPLCERLTGEGHQIGWWREDHPAERTPAPYVEDPSGNRVQLAGGRSTGIFDHVALEFADLEWAEDLYVRVLGAEIDHYHGWSSDRGPEVEAWLAGTDPAAPWTRYTRFSFRSRTDEAHATPQLYLRLGGARLAMFLARRHVQEPPEEVVRGTPRLVFSVDRPPSEVAAYFDGRGREIIAERYRGRTIRHETDDDNIFIRDPGGNFIELRYGG
ncbi:MAG: hypothetical protein HW416_3009 [Chloroflexi bacterium]|nr:hypothetical protein [Chloroflexota bacterium]